MKPCINVSLRCRVNKVNLTPRRPRKRWSPETLRQRFQRNCHARQIGRLGVTFPIARLRVNNHNRYRRELETCPQANMAESGREYFLLFLRRVRATSMTQRRVEDTRVHFWTFSPVSVNACHPITLLEIKTVIYLKLYLFHDFYNLHEANHRFKLDFIFENREKL